MLVKTTIKEIISKTKREYKYFNGLDFKKELTGTEYIVNFLCTDGITYTYNFSDGRKANAFYAGKEIWGMVREKTNGIRFEYWWWTKEKFEEVVRTHILRTEECMKSDAERITYLKSII